MTDQDWDVDDRILTIEGTFGTLEHTLRFAHRDGVILSWTDTEITAFVNNPLAGAWGVEVIYPEGNAIIDTALLNCEIELFFHGNPNSKII
ncbi:MAG: hypothetical protein COA94_07785 [Rickettsiales bacterium]|nr:MAG: hypothetical protein COA94_07785 [Rickettsiales bacterium]